MALRVAGERGERRRRGHILQSWVHDAPWCYCREVRVFHRLLIIWNFAYWFATQHQSSVNPPARNTDTILIMMCFNIRFRFSEGFENMVIFVVLHFFMNTSQDLVLNSASDRDMCPKEMLNTRPGSPRTSLLLITIMSVLRTPLLATAGVCKKVLLMSFCLFFEEFL